MGFEDMTSNWIKVTVEDIKSSCPNALATGPFGSSISSKFFQDYGVPVIRGGNLSENINLRLIDENLVFLSKEKAQEFKRSIVRKGDLIFTSWGTIGQVGLIDDRCKYSEYVVSNKQMKFTPDSEKADSLFLYYLFSSPEISGRIKNEAIGSSVPGYNLTLLRSIELRLPPLSEQKAIAHILSSFDDKIELNRQMNETLEAMARAIFKSWFVDFDPVSAKRSGRQPAGMDTATADLFPDEFEESSLGLIPKGWRVGTLGDIAENPRRGVKPENITPNTPYIGLEHMPKRSISLSDWGSVEDINSNKYQFYQGEILFGKLRPYFHKVGVAALDGICSTDILVITPKLQEWFSFVLSIVSSDDFINYTNITSTGTRMPRTNWNDMSKYEIIIPSIEIVKTFNYQLVPFVNKIKSHIFESHTLATIRDTLLPKLMSGEIRVKEAEKIINDKL